MSLLRCSCRVITSLTSLTTRQPEPFGAQSYSASMNINMPTIENNASVHETGGDMVKISDAGVDPADMSV